MTSVNLPAPPRISTDPRTNSDAQNWAQAVVDMVEKAFQRSLEVLGGKPIREASGSASGTYPGASNTSSLMTIAHGLGAVPNHAWGFSSKPGQADYVYTDTAADATNLYLKCANPLTVPAATTTCVIDWFARL